VVTISWSAFLLAALKALPALISVFVSIKQDADAAHNQGIGYDKAVKDALEAKSARVAEARQVEVDAEKEHATKADDTAFDQDFRR
jgi:hypothetical protein